MFGERSLSRASAGRLNFNIARRCFPELTGRSNEDWVIEDGYAPGNRLDFDLVLDISLL